MRGWHANLFFFFLLAESERGQKVDDLAKGGFDCEVAEVPESTVTVEGTNTVVKSFSKSAQSIGADGTKVTLYQRDIWARFHKETTEMLVTKAGRLARSAAIFLLCAHLDPTYHHTPTSTTTPLPPLPHPYLHYHTPTSTTTPLPPLPHPYLHYHPPTSTTTPLPPLPHPYLHYHTPTSTTTPLPPLPHPLPPLPHPYLHHHTPTSTTTPLPPPPHPYLHYHTPTSTTTPLPPLPHPYLHYHTPTSTTTPLPPPPHPYMYITLKALGVVIFSIIFNELISPVGRCFLQSVSVLLAWSPPNCTP